MARLHTLQKEYYAKSQSSGNYVCDTCGKSFRRSCSLKAHQSAHPANPNVCKVCGKIYLSEVFIIDVNPPSGLHVKFRHSRDAFSAFKQDSQKQPSHFLKNTAQPLFRTPPESKKICAVHF